MDPKPPWSSTGLELVHKTSNFYKGRRHLEIKSYELSGTSFTYLLTVFLANVELAELAASLLFGQVTLRFFCPGPSSDLQSEHFPPWVLSDRLSVIARFHRF